MDTDRESEDTDAVLTDRDFRRPHDQWMGGCGIIVGALLTLIVPWWVVIIAALMTLVGAVINIWKVLTRVTKNG